MSYQVTARKWRPQKFGDVIGQQAVTRTLRNALASQRLAQAFVFAGPRGVGKTTTARILARALNCINGPTPDPCGVCDACIEIAEGRDMDVLEIDAATHTQVDNIREVIIHGLSIAPVRNRYKVFIIDEVHQLSSASFNALLKSIEEPPPHVVFMMATTELEKIPETVLSRSQVYEFRTISTKMIADQLRVIVDAEEIAVGDESLQLIARDAEGSMRDAQSKLDQVVAFTGKTVGAEDVATVLGLVGRDLLLDTLQAVADEDAAAAFALAARAVEMGYDLRAVVRELSRVVRDLLVLSVDPTRIGDPEIAGEGEREHLKALTARFSREDLLRAFDLLTRAEAEVRTAAQPRYHLEMALLRWIHLRKLVSIEDLIAGSGFGAAPGPSRTLPSKPAPAARPPAPSATAYRRNPRRLPDRRRHRPLPLRPPDPRRLRLPHQQRRRPRRLRRAISQTVSRTRSLRRFGRRRPCSTTPWSPRRRRSRWPAIASPSRSRRSSARSAMSSTGIARGSSRSRGRWLGARSASPACRATRPSRRRRPPPRRGRMPPPPRNPRFARKRWPLADSSVQAMLEVFPAEIRDVEEM